MGDVTLDRTGLVFFSFSLVLACWAVFDTPRFLWLLSYGRKRAFTKFQLLGIRVPGTVCILSLIWLLLTNFLHK